jgi:hypothetical protein
MIVVMGDSRAQMWMPTILRMAVRDGWVVIPFVKVGCIPSSWIRSKRWCGAWYRWALRHAKALHPDVTLIAGSWAATKKPDRDIKAVASLSGAMRRLSASVIVVGDAPHQSLSPVDCLLAPHSTMRTCTTRVTKVQFHADTVIASDARGHGIGFMHTRGWFCAKPTASTGGYLCPLVINRTITCTDRGHMTQTYGLELVGPFRSAFRRELFR